MRRTNQVLFSVAIVAVTILATTSFAQQGKGRGNFGGGTGTLASIAANEAVQKDLGLSGDIVAKLNSLREDVTAARQKEFQNAGISFQGIQNQSAEERRKMRDKFAEVDKKLNDEFNPKVKALVSPDQYKRLQQIQLQANLRLRGPGALTYADVASELKLSDEQKKKLDDLQSELDAKQRDLAQGGGFDRAAAAKLTEDQNNKAMEALTGDQKEKLAALKGQSFDVTQLFMGAGRRGKGN